MEFEDETPVVEARAFESGIEPMMTSMQTLTPTRSSEEDDSSETSSDENSEPDSSESQHSNNEKGKVSKVTVAKHERTQPNCSQAHVPWGFELVSRARLSWYAIH